MSPILFAIYTLGLIKWVEEYVSEAEVLSLVDELGLVATGSDVNHVVSRLERCAEKTIEWPSRRGLQVDAAKTEEAQFTRRRGHRKNLKPKLPAKLRVRNESVLFIAQATHRLGVWMQEHLAFNEHHNQCMKNPRAADARL